MEDGEGVTTEFNAAIASLYRLHNLLVECNEFSRLSRIHPENTKYLKAWKASVLSVFQEIIPKLNDDERSGVERKIGFYRHPKISRLVVDKRSEEGVVSVVDQRVYERIVELTRRIESDLRVLADKKGMLIPNRASPGSAISVME